MSVTLLGHLELADRNIDRAQALLEQSVVLHDALGNRLYLPWSPEGLDQAAAAVSEWQRTAYLGGARDAL
jgi:hypothetical protein